MLSSHQVLFGDNTTSKQKKKISGNTSVQEEEDAHENKTQNEEPLPNEKVKSAFPVKQKDLDRNKAKEKAESADEKQKLQALLAESNTVLMKFKSVFPFDFFPDEVTIDIKRVNVITREFFSSERIHSIDIEDIEDVVVDTSLFFATVTLVVRGFIENCVEIKFVKNHEALKARRIIQGLITACKEKLDLSKINDRNLLAKIEEMGSVQKK